MTTLSSYNDIQSNIFVRLPINQYKVNPGDAYTSMVLRFSDKIVPYTINGEEYKGIGNLMGITDTTSELKASEQDITITITGIPNSSIYEIMNSKIKGCPITIYRGLFNPTTEALLPLTTNPILKFQGYVNNISLSEEFTMEDKTIVNTLTLVCSNKLKILNNKKAGRQTNSHSMKRYYPTDVSFDRVSSLENSNFNFGKKS